MAHLTSQLVGQIIDSYSDVIEGGNSYAAGTSFPGIPGTQSNDSWVRAQTTIDASAAGTTTSIVCASGVSGDSTKWVRATTPGLFLRCNAGAVGSVDYARRITGWDLTTTTFTVDAFPVAPGADGAFTVLQGFKRLPNGIDIEASVTDQPQGFDRFFDIRLVPLKPRDYYGSGAELWDASLELRLRLLKMARLQDARASMVENLTILGSALIKGEFRDATYVRGVRQQAEGPEIVADDPEKLVAKITLPIIYRVMSNLA